MTDFTQAFGGFTLTGMVSFLSDKTVGDKTYYNFKVGHVPFSMTGKSGEWAKEHDLEVCTVFGSVYAQEQGYSVKLFASNVFPCRL